MDTDGLIAELGVWFLLLCGGLCILWDRRRARRKARIAEDGPEDERYRVFTRAYDVELSHTDIPIALHKASADIFKFPYDRAGKWATNRNFLERFDAAQPSIHAVETELREAIDTPADLAITILVDQSGSMLGAPIAATASALHVVIQALARLGAATEILGFSTAGWHGGFAREEWLRTRRPSRPGRLCALAHFVYKRFDETDWTDASRDAFLHPDVLRENIDGEALEWAHSRLSQCSTPRKLLILLSDGAPVDDSTLQENGPSYLERHLLATISHIEADGAIRLGSIGVGHDVQRYYSRSLRAEPAEIAETMTQLIVELASPERPATG